MLGLAGGVGHGGDDTGALLGASVGWEITPAIGIEGAGAWIDRDRGARAFSASLGVRVRMTPARAVAPFVTGGFGLYLASFDPKRATQIPAFYADRISGAGTNTFTDPAFFGNVGVDLFRRHRFTVSPTVGILLAADDQRTFAIGSFFVQASYRFEKHPPRKP